MKNDITAIYPNNKGIMKRVSDWFERKINHFINNTLSFEEKDMPIETSVNNIADFVLNRETEQSIELIKMINTEIEKRLSANSEKFLKKSATIKAYLKTKK